MKMEKQEFKADQAGRLDVVLAAVSSLSRSQAGKAIKLGQVEVNSKVIHAPSYRVAPWQVLS